LWHDFFSPFKNKRQISERNCQRRNRSFGPRPELDGVGGNRIGLVGPSGFSARLDVDQHPRGLGHDLRPKIESPSKTENRNLDRESGKQPLIETPFNRKHEQNNSNNRYTNKNFSKKLVDLFCNFLFVR
jgi:hypothetical protein